MSLPTTGKRWLLFLLLILATLPLTACSGGKEKSDQSSIKESTEKVAAQAEEHLKTSLEKAREISAKGSERLDAMNKALTDHE